MKQVKSVKVLIISNYYYPHTGGIEQVARDISNILKEDKTIEHKIICFNEDARRDGFVTKRSETVTDAVDGVEVCRCGCFSKIASQSLSLTYHKELKRMLKDFDPDVIVFEYPNPFVASLLLLLIRDHTKLIVHWQLDITKQKILGKLFHYQNLRLLNRADRIIATSPNYIEGSYYLSKFREKCTVIPNCVSVDYNNISEETRKKADEIREAYKNKFICFTVGRHIPYKGFEYLIEASRYLNDDYVILIGGRGPLTEKLKEQARNDSKVVFVDFVSDADLPAYYLACDIITFSSITKNEAFGLSLAEGMSFGKPAVTFTIDGSGVNYVNLNGVSGLECPNRDSKAYAEAIRKLHENKKLYATLARNAKARVMELFTFDQFKDTISTLLYNIK